MMPKFPVVGSKKLIRFFEMQGYRKVPGQGKGSHTTMKKKGVDKLMVIPHSLAVPIWIIKKNLKIAGISEEYFRAAMQGRKKSR